MAKALSSMPLLRIPVTRERSTRDFNPWAINAQIHQEFDSPIYRTEARAADGLVTAVWICDEQAARQVLENAEGIWLKGPQTVEPFSSLVPKHVIAIEGAEHRLMRSAAQSALGDLVAEGILPDLARQTGARLVAKVRQVISGSRNVWFARPSQFERKPAALCTQIDRMFRAAALDIVSAAIFGQSWGALDDYSPSNVLADSLGKVMYELHWRVVDLSQRDWRANPRSEPAGALLAVLDTFIAAQMALKNDMRPRCMLRAWMDDPALSRAQVSNLCMTFLTMGHENVASGLAWTLINLAQQPSRDPDLRQAFHEAVRLYPSVAGLTRTNTQPTTLLGFEIPAGTEVVVEMFALHRLTKTWGPDAEQFRPSRCPHVSTSGPPDAFPFGVGARSCLGRPLSYVELDALVGQLLANFDIVAVACDDPSTRADRPTQPTNMVSLRPGAHAVVFRDRVSSQL